MRGATRPLLLALGAVLSWSTVATAFKIALSQLSVTAMVLTATATATLIFAVWLTVTRGWGELRRLTPALLPRFALSGLVVPTAYYLVLFTSYDYLPAQIAQPINYLWPIILAVMLAVFGHKRIPAYKYAGMAVSLGGLVMISLGGQGITGTVSVPGLLLGFGSAFLWALYWLVNDSLKGVMGQVPTLFVSFLFGLVFISLWSLFVSPGPVDADGLLAGAYIGAFEMAIPFICFGVAIRTTDNPALVNQLCYLSPFLSLFLIATVLGEPIMPTTYLGLMLIVGGLLYNETLAERRSARA